MYDTSSFVGQGPVEDAASQEGFFHAEGQSPGRLTIQVRDSVGSVVYLDRGAWLSSETASPPSSAIQTVIVKEVLTLGGRPLAATLWLGGRRARAPRGWTRTRRGASWGRSRRTGAGRSRLKRRTRPCGSRRRSGSARAARARRPRRLTPDTHLYGRVVLEDGRPALGALGFVRTPSEAFPAEAEAKGGVRPPYARRGAAGPRSPGTGGNVYRGDKVGMVLSHDQEIGPVQLTLRKRKILMGHLRSARGAVPNARVSPSRPGRPEPPDSRTRCREPKAAPSPAPSRPPRRSRIF